MPADFVNAYILGSGWQTWHFYWVRVPPNFFKFREAIDGIKSGKVRVANGLVVAMHRYYSRKSLKAY